MGQRVVLKIAGKEYELDAATPEGTDDARCSCRRQ